MCARIGTEHRMASGAWPNTPIARTPARFTACWGSTPSVPDILRDRNGNLRQSQDLNGRQWVSRILRICVASVLNSFHFLGSPHKRVPGCEY